MPSKHDITIWHDQANMRTVVRTPQGVMQNERGHPADIGPDRDGKTRWNSVDDALKHFAKVDRILRSL